MTTIPLIKAIQGIFVTREIYIFTNSVSVGVTEVKIKTGIVAYASTDATPSLKICDGLNTCCDTSGLDNYGNDRPSGQVDVYQAEWQLGNCTEVDHKCGNFSTQKMDIFRNTHFGVFSCLSFDVRSILIHRATGRRALLCKVMRTTLMHGLCNVFLFLSLCF